jgi:ribosomal protein S27AE
MHHIVPRHAGGTDDPSNLIKLTVEEHADAHRKLYEQYGRWQDYLAWKGLSGRIDKEELIRQMTSIVHKGKVVSEETKAKQSKAKMGKNNPMYGTVSPNAGKFGEDSPRWGLKHSDDTKAKISESAKNRKKIDCPHCGKSALPGHYGRWHKDGKCLK